MSIAACGLSLSVLAAGFLINYTVLTMLILFIRDTSVIRGLLVNSDDLDEMLHKAAFHQGLHCLLREHHPMRNDRQPLKIQQPLYGTKVAYLFVR